MRACVDMWRTWISSKGKHEMSETELNGISAKDYLMPLTIISPCLQTIHGSSLNRTPGCKDMQGYKLRNAPVLTGELGNTRLSKDIEDPSAA